MHLHRQERKTAIPTKKKSPPVSNHRESWNIAKMILWYIQNKFYEDGYRVCGRRGNETIVLKRKTQKRYITGIFVQFLEIVMDCGFHFCIRRKLLPSQPSMKVLKHIIIEEGGLCEIGWMCGVTEHVPTKIVEKKHDELSLARSGIVMQQDHSLWQFTSMFLLDCRLKA